MSIPQILILQMDQELCAWDFQFLKYKNVRFKLLSTYDALVEFANNWLKLTEDQPGLLIISTHGMRGTLFTRSGFSNLDEFISKIGPLFNKAVHLSSCAALQVKDQKLKELLNKSGALTISGYQSSVNAADSAQIEAFLLSRLASPIRKNREITMAYESTFKAFPELIYSTGFCYVARN